MNLLLKNIKQLLTLKGPECPRTGKELSDIGIIKNALLYIESGRIKYFGKESEVIEKIMDKKFEEIDADGIVMPSFVDSHTHTIFAKPRLKDFQMRTSGMSYQEIKKNGGGINRSVEDIRNSTKEEIIGFSLKNLKRFIECGTLSLEIKSGYGLDFENEVKILEIIKEISNKSDISIFSTFLGAHSLPPGFNSSKEYLDFLKEKLIPYVSKNKLASYADIFCEKGYFGVEESMDYLEFAKKYGLKPRIHAEQLSKFGASIVASKVGAVSADHLDFADEEYIKLLKKSSTVATFLPASNYFLGLEKFPDARKFIENGNIVSLATDFNPGTSPCWNMQFVISLALTHMKMKIEEAIVSATYNSAYSLGISDRVGMIDVEKDADLIIMDVKDYREIGYYFGDNLNKVSIKKGVKVYDKNSAF